MKSNDKTAEELRVENERLRQAYDYILSSRNNVDKELVELQKSSAQQLKEYKEVIRELLPLAESGQAYYRQNPGFNWVKEREKSAVIIHKARKLIDQTDSTK